jgi:YhcH/YjgK/YiaL family protein
MIVSTLSTCERYYALGEGFKRAFEFLRNNDIRNMEPGRYDIDGDKVYVFVQEYVSKTIDNCGLEAHRRYADIQYVAEGFEYFGYVSLESRSLSTTRKQMQCFLKKSANSFFSKKAILPLFSPKMRICRKKGH